MSLDFTRSIIRILNQYGHTAGTGFVLSNDGLMVTCAHVVRTAKPQLDGTIKIEFYHSDNQVIAAIEPNGWFPKEDVAILRVQQDEVPPNVVPVTLGSSKTARGHSFYSHGYAELPEDEPGTETPDTPANGEIVGYRTSPAGKWELVLSTKYALDGISGAPVLDTDDDRVVGMIRTAFLPPEGEGVRAEHTAFAVPIETIARICPSIKLVPPRKAPFLAPRTPDYFVSRPEIIEELKARLLTETEKTALAITAIQGLGGIGKSTLAAALAEDSEVKQHFADGVLWATLGQQPDLLSELQKWIVALHDLNADRLTNVGAASTYLKTLLQEKTLLMIVDDAWEPAHIKYFIQAKGPQCRVLITTREVEVATAAGIEPHSLDVMTPEQSLTLMSSQIGRALEGEKRRLALSLANEVGYLPLALELAAAQIKDGIHWAELLSELRQEIARLEILEIPGVEKLKDEADARNAAYEHLLT